MSETPVIIENCKHERTVHLGALEALELCADCGSVFNAELTDLQGGLDFERGEELFLGRSVVMQIAEAVLLEIDMDFEPWVRETVAMEQTLDTLDEALKMGCD